MTGPDLFRPDHPAAPHDPQPPSSASSDAPQPGSQPPERLARLADLVAGGEVAFPTGLDPAEDERLTAMIRARLRARLVRFIAQQIALAMHREREAGPLESRR
jgi:hypothetical protein